MEKRGSPCGRGDARRAAMLHVAWRMFLEKGYEAVSLSDVVSQSGGSKATLYAAFGGKEGLFIAACEERCAAFLDKLALSADPLLPVEESLRHFALSLLENLYSDESRDVMRLILGAAQKFPSVAEAFLERGPGQVRRRLEEYLAWVDRSGLLEIDNPRIAAEVFLSMVQGRWYLIALDSRRRQVVNDEDLATILEHVRVFIRGYRPRDAGERSKF